MAVSQDITPGGASQAFPAMLVTKVMEGRWRAPKVGHGFPGVVGIKEYLDVRKERTITAEAVLYDRVSLAALNADLLTIEGFTNALTGTLTIDGTSYIKCTFDGIAYRETWKADGIHLYRRKITLHWTQRSSA